MVGTGEHTTVTGSGFQINVAKHVAVSSVDMSPASHWKVTVDPISLLATGKRTPSMKSVGMGHPPKLTKGLTVNRSVFSFSSGTNARRAVQYRYAIKIKVSAASRRHSHSINTMTKSLI